MRAALLTRQVRSDRPCRSTLMVGFERIGLACGGRIPTRLAIGDDFVAAGAAQSLRAVTAGGFTIGAQTNGGTGPDWHCSPACWALPITWPGSGCQRLEPRAAIHFNSCKTAVMS